MNLKRSAIILCLMAWLFFLAYPALAGQGCGTNWLGADTNDKDFWVSKNQNKGVSSPGTGVSASTTGTATVGAAAAGTAAIGSVNNALLKSLDPDRAGPQMAGATIVWTANMTGTEEGLLYKFLLKGPVTEGQLLDKTGWKAANTWTWNTTQADVGENQVEVRVRSSKYLGTDENGFDESASAKYVITTEEAQEVEKPAPVDPNPHPKSRTAEASSVTTKPRIAPDERPKAPAGNPNGPNMSMPDPTPKPPANTDETSAEDTIFDDSSEVAGADFQEIENPFESPEESILDMGGKWTVKLTDLGSSIELVLIQTGERLMGSGTLSEGKTKIPVTASGSVSRDRLELDVKTVVGDYVNQIDKSYNIRLASSDGTYSGDYEAYEGEKFIGEGNATAVKPGL